jgi:hypothetical protein
MNHLSIYDVKAVEEILISQDICTNRFDARKVIIPAMVSGRLYNFEGMMQANSGGAQYEKAMSIEEIEQILSIKNIPGVDQLEEIKQIYVAKAPQVARDKEVWQSKSRSLQLAVR